MNKPELLPTGEFTPVIDVAGFLTDGEVRRFMLRARSRVCVQNLGNGCRRWERDGVAVQLVPLLRAGANNLSVQQPVCAVASKPVVPLPLQERRIRERVEALEADTGVKLRVLAQNYPQVRTGRMS